MTTIAYKDGVMAADTLISYGDSRIGFIDKIGKVPAQIPGVFKGAFFGALYGTTGAFRDVEKVHVWAKSHGLDPAMAPDLDKDTCILMIDASGQAYNFERAAPWSPFRMIRNCTAIGSGGPEARGALLAGATAQQAVEIAAELDAHTLGPFQAVALDSHMAAPGRVARHSQLSHDHDDYRDRRARHMAFQDLRAQIMTETPFNQERPTKITVTPRIPETD